MWNHHDARFNDQICTCFIIIEETSKTKTGKMNKKKKKEKKRREISIPMKTQRVSKKSRLILIGQRHILISFNYFDWFDVIGYGLGANFTRCNSLFVFFDECRDYVLCKFGFLVCQFHKA